MAKTVEDFKKRLASLIQDPANKLEGEDRSDIVKKAIAQVYSKDRPQEKVVEIEGNGTNDVAAPAAYIDGFSILKKIEFPIGNVPATYLDDDAFMMYRTPTGLKVRFLGTQPGNGEKAWITITAPHASDASTVPEVDFEALCDCAAAIALEVLATRYAGTSDPTINADVVNYRDKSQVYQALAKTAWARYYKALGIQAGGGSDASAGQAPAVAVGEMEASLSFGGDRLTHARRR